MATLEGQTSYGPVAKSLHWIAAVCVLLAWAIGNIGDEIPRASEATALTIHMWLGFAVLAILVLRLVARVASHPSSDTTSFSPWLNYLATASHWLLYALMAAVPVVGIVLQFARGEALSVFGLLHIASPWLADRAFAHSLKEVHEFLANAMVIVAALHIAAALFHHFILRDRTLQRMLPQRRLPQ
ncbi:cytochrome b [Reyranella soli]|uniref:Cytochrome b561 n=1 Tax=Reyranella soli TaxID=1230389 RepID=A0A512NCX3_9HYPH|nr:cytochrome b [Reyranella soli]GEP56785.1 cytochrome b561 [Reyranella soli]